MEDRGGRVMLGVALLALIWIGVYWVWQPGILRDSPRLSFAEEPTAPPADMVEATEREPEPEPTPPEVEPEPTDPQPPAPVVEPPRFRDYIVQDGDTLEKIAQRELGRRSYWSAIAQANPLRDPRRLRPGDEIRIPIDPTNIQGREIDPDETEEPAEPSDGIPRYTVVSGDTLSRIAEAHYGSAGFGEFIYFHNRDVLTAPDELDPGTVLQLPPLPDGG